MDMKKSFLLTIVLLVSICLSNNTLFAQEGENDEKIKPWTDVVKNTSDPASWRWNKNENSRFTIRGDWDGDGFDEMLYEGATKLFSDNNELTPLNLPGDLGVFFLVNEGDLDGDGGDEISFMSVNRDYSNFNVYRIWSYTGNRWQEIFQVRVHIWDCPNYQPKNFQESFTHEWKKKNNFSLNKIILKKHDGIVDVIGIHPNGRYAIEEIKIINKGSTKRKWGKVIQPRED
ncbi:MAG: hypothetical protein H6Q15_517 [Bacteroidetes bacterium]|nr:hypothetical protein [Bacteroidota bacterium]